MERKQEPFFVYLLRCSDGTLYCGITTDPQRRLAQHNSGTGAKYTRSRRPVELVFLRQAADRSQALRLEAHIKKLNRSQKLVLIGAPDSPEADELLALACAPVRKEKKQTAFS
ncbi:MAG: GIY-YIG nuclease family protein [Firmicutes bacterium]|nr:GIY-YIG nuclease family protein [Bacillota bacterium]